MKIILLLLALLLSTPSSLQAQTVCDEQGNATCAESFRICLDTNGIQDCTNCLNGYIVINTTSNVCVDIDSLDFEDYVIHHEPQYSADNVTIEERSQYLKANLQAISAWNSQIPPPSHLKGINPYTADTPSDASQIRGFVSDEHDFEDLAYNASKALPSSINWVELGAVTDVVNQQRCACCWAISTVEAVEGAAFLTNQTRESLSFQQLISCNEDNNGCTGGKLTVAFNYVNENEINGVLLDQQYPFTDGSGETTTECLLNEQSSAAAKATKPYSVLDASDTYSFEERLARMKAAVARQPVAFAAATNCDTFTSYSSGILQNDGDCACTETSCIDHAMLLVGYDDTTDPPYWLVKVRERKLEMTERGKLYYLFLTTFFFWHL